MTIRMPMKQKAMNKADKKIIKLAIQALRERRRLYAAGKDAAAQGFQFGINAAKHYEEYTEAIERLEKMMEGNDG